MVKLFTFSQEHSLREWLSRVSSVFASVEKEQMPTWVCSFQSCRANFLFPVLKLDTTDDSSMTSLSSPREIELAEHANMRKESGAGSLLLLTGTCSLHVLVVGLGSWS